MPPEVLRFPQLEQAQAAAAELLSAVGREAVAARGRFLLALSGGSTPRGLYHLLGRAADRLGFPWREIHLCQVDERCVPRDHPDSNWRLLAETLLAALAFAPGQVHRLPGEVTPPARAAAQAEADLRQLFASAEPGGGFPVFDCVLLGMGTDGHTASLFPGSPLLQETALWVAAEERPVGRPAVPRLTLTLPVLNAARVVVFLVAGEDKARLVEAILADPNAAERYPAARVQPERLTWLVAD